MIHKSSSKMEISKTPFIYPAGLNLSSKPRLILEIGPGRGDFLFHLAKTNTDAMIVGVEIKRKRIDRLIKRVENRNLKNVILFQDDARTALPHNINDSSVDAIYINFPDPWPKSRHEKNRLLNSKFLNECTRILKPQGTLNFSTDVLCYSQEVANSIGELENLKSCYPEVIVSSSTDAFPTFFAEKWKSKSRKLYYQKYERTT